MVVPNQEMHRIVTTAIIFRQFDGRVLIIRRAADKKVWPGKWTVPGGGLETDDYTIHRPSYTGETYQWYNSLFLTLRREVREETGLLIREPWLICDLTFIRPDGIPVLVLSYGAYLVPDGPNGEARVRLNEESDDWQWVNLEEAKGYDLIDGIYQEIELAYEH
jgi:8-oxo-dGTP pyrophosphatase MutT (NUDIX family)